MSAQLAGIGKVELRVIPASGKMNVNFWYEDQEYRTIYLDGGCENILIGEWEESVCAWARLEVVVSEQDRGASKIEFKTNVTTPSSRAVLEHLVSKANAAISNGQNTTIDMTNELQSIGWDMYLSNDPTPK